MSDPVPLKKAGEIGASFPFGEVICGLWKSNSTVEATEGIFLAAVAVPGRRRKAFVPSDRSGKANSMVNATLDEQLWQTVIDSAGALKIDASCQLFLQAWIANGIERMVSENRTDAKDVAEAKENLKTFVEQMKQEAFARGGEHLDNKCFHAAEHSLERRSRITVFSLWPFWPHAVSG